MIEKKDENKNRNKRSNSSYKSFEYKIEKYGIKVTNKDQNQKEKLEQNIDFFTYKTLLDTLESSYKLNDYIFRALLVLILDNNNNVIISQEIKLKFITKVKKYDHLKNKEFASFLKLSYINRETKTQLIKLTNWYIRLNRGRLKGDFDMEDWINSLNILFITLLNLVILLSPFIPFITEFIYQNLRNGLKEGNALLEKSIHFLRIPEYDEKLLDDKIEKMMNNMISVIELGRKLREKNKISLKKPVAKLVIINYDEEFLNNVKTVEKYIVEELNVNEIEYEKDEATYITLGIKPNYEILYKKCKEIKDDMITLDKKDDPELIKEEKEAKDEANKIANVIKKLNYDEIRKLIEKGNLEKDNIVIEKEQVNIEKKFLPQYEIY